MSTKRLEEYRDLIGRIDNILIGLLDLRRLIGPEATKNLFDQLEAVRLKIACGIERLKRNSDSPAIHVPEVEATKLADLLEIAKTFKPPLPEGEVTKFVKGILARSRQAQEDQRAAETADSKGGAQ